MLRRFGWSPGRGIGENGEGISEPIRLVPHEDSRGLGRKEIEMARGAVAAKERRKLSGEKQETDEERREREKKAGEDDERARTVLEQMSKFYCDLCHKQYHTVGEWENHLASYDHNHTRRRTDMREQRMRQQRDDDEEGREESLLAQQIEIRRQAALERERQLQSRRGGSESSSSASAAAASSSSSVPQPSSFVVSFRMSAPSGLSRGGEPPLKRQKRPIGCFSSADDEDDNEVEETKSSLS